MDDYFQAVLSGSSYDRMIPTHLQKGKKGGKRPIRPLKIGNVVFTNPFCSCPCCGSCSVCGKFARYMAGGKLKLCSRCKGVYYCSASCQKKAWKTHKKECNDVSKCIISQWRMEYNLGYMNYSHGREKKGVKHFKVAMELFDPLMKHLCSPEIFDGIDVEVAFGNVFIVDTHSKMNIYLGKCYIYLHLLEKLDLVIEKDPKILAKGMKKCDNLLRKALVYVKNGIDQVNDSVTKPFFGAYLCEAHIALGKIYYIKKQFKTARKELLEGLKYAKVEENELFFLRTFELMILVSIQLPQYAKEGMKYAREGMRLLRSIKTRTKDNAPLLDSLPYYPYYLGVLKCLTGKIKEALSSFKESVKYFKKMEDGCPKNNGLIMIYTGLAVYYSCYLPKHQKSGHFVGKYRQYCKNGREAFEQGASAAAIDNVISLKKMMARVKQGNFEDVNAFSFFEFPNCGVREVSVFWT